MNAISGHSAETVRLGIGFYTVPEASRLLGTPALNIRRWLGGYRYRHGDQVFAMPPLWTPQLPVYGQHIELGFRDLIELRFVKAFLRAGLRLHTIRNCLDYARKVVGDDRPFSTSRFRTDGRTIFLESASEFEDHLLDLLGGQFALRQVIDRTFRDLDIEDDTVARWRPFHGKSSIVLDPRRAFGQPIAARYGVPTATLADAAEAESSVGRVASLYEVSVSVVRDAVAFEAQLQTA